MSTNTEAIQIIRSVENQDASSNVIQLIEKYENGPKLEDVLCRENKDLPLFVISICGKTRTGKSFLLNLMIKYLESKRFEDWTNGQLPNVFEWKGGITSITKGLWICPKVFRRTNTRGEEVGILLLDNQGLFDGEQTEGVSVAISGISTSLSFYQIFNLKERICENDLESIWRHLIPDDSNTSEDSCTTKLMFVVRDFCDEEYESGLEHGKAYIEADKTRGTEAHKKMWSGLKKTFPDIGCLLLPDPGANVRRGNIREMKDIDPQFLEEAEHFFNKIFDPKYLIVTRNIPTGQICFENLKKFDGKEANESLSFINVFTEEGNHNKLESLKMNFDLRFEAFLANPSMGQTMIEEYLTVAEKRFKGRSADDFLAELEKFVMQKINLWVKKLILEKYKARLETSSDATYTHSLEWNSANTRLTYFVGSEVEKEELKKEVIIGCAELYYNKLKNDLNPKFESYCKHKTLEELQGFDESFVSREFKENKDFMFQNNTTSCACNLIWLKEREILRMAVQDKLLKVIRKKREEESCFLF